MAQTRVEKFAEYRKEIDRLTEEKPLTTEQKISNVINENSSFDEQMNYSEQKKDSLSVSLDSVLKTSDILGNKVKKEYPLEGFEKKWAKFYILLGSLSLVVLILIIVLGIMIWG